MTRERVRELLPIMQAYAEGKTIQFLDGGNWYDVYDTDFYKSPDKYRIKPEPKYRPFKNQEECWQEMQKHHPFGWIKKNGNYINITLVSVGCNYNKDLKNLTFADGTPFGIKEQ